MTMEKSLPENEAISGKQLLEETFLAGLERDDIPVDAMLEILDSLVASGHTSLAVEWAELLVESLVARRDDDGVLKTLQRQVTWQPAPKAFNQYCRASLREVFRDRLSVAMLDAAGIGVLPPDESLRRFRLLLSCKPGTFCLEKTWGTGVIRDLDEFYRKVTIDFTRRKGHPLTFEYAAQTLELIPPDHILARIYSDRRRSREAANENPAATVMEVLECMGNMTAARLEAFLVENEILDSGGWKNFWDGARKTLAENPLVRMPVKKNEALQLVPEREPESETEELERLAAMRDPAEIYSFLKEWFECGKEPAEEDRKVILERMAFALKGAGSSNSALFARLTLLAYANNLTELDLDSLRRYLIEENRLIAVARKLPVREVPSLCEFIMSDEQECRKLVDRLDRLPLGMVEEAIRRLSVDPGLSETLFVRLRELLNSVDVSLTLLVWGCRHVEEVEEKGIVAPGDLLVHAVAGIETPRRGEDLRMQNLIRKSFENVAWLKKTMAGMNDMQRRGLLERVQSSRGWDSTAKRGVMAGMIKLFPGLESQTARDPESSSAPTRARITSWRSFREHAGQLRKLIEEEIPANSKEIGVARGYGDLRENFEYHAARHQQGLLMRRRAELEKDLAEVQGTGFEDIPIDRIAPGVTVLLKKPDGGGEQRITILGEWDRDENLGIISSRSRVGENLAGSRAGDRVALPDGDVVVAAIEPLSPEIRKWIASENKEKTGK